MSHRDSTKKCSHLWLPGGSYKDDSAANPILSNGYGNLIQKAFLCGHELRHCSTSGWYHLVRITVSKDCGFRSYITVHGSTFKPFPTQQFIVQSIVYYITNTAMYHCPMYISFSLETS